MNSVKRGFLNLAILTGVLAITCVATAFSWAAGREFEGVKLTYVTTSPMVTSNLDKEFEKQTGAKVEVTTVAWPDLHTKLVTTFSAKSPNIDLFIFPDEWTEEFGKAGWYVPLERYLDSAEKSDISPAYIELYAYRGHLAGFPIMAMPMLLFYNEKMLSDAGFKPAATWQELKEQSIAMQKAGICKYGVTWPLLSGDDMSFDTFHTLLLANGGTLFDKSGNPAFNSEKGLETLQFIVDSLYSSKFASPTSIQVEKLESLNPFMAGENPYNLNWQFMYGMTTSSQTSAIWKYSKCTTVPSRPGVAKTGIIAGAALGINPYSKHKEAAIAYAKFIFAKENALRNFKEKGWLPGWRSFYKDPDALATDPQLPIYLAQIEKSAVRPKITWYTEFAELMRLELSRAWLRECTPKKALEAAEQKVKAKIAQYEK
ncbi:MAG TPA: sugar ABC transporter substrate-binding protein [Firmicutes bacterium]|nr:sugar ABC transporter substrate-binding protein [Bacillota bacterium]